MSSNHISKSSSSNVMNLYSLNHFNIKIHHLKPKITTDVLWKPLTLSWNKCKFFDMTVGISSFCTCGGIFRNDKTNHLDNFVSYISYDNALLDDLTGAVMAIKLAWDINWNKLWLKSDSLLVVKNFSIFYMIHK